MMRDIRTNKRLMMECSTENLGARFERGVSEVWERLCSRRGGGVDVGGPKWSPPLDKRRLLPSS